MSVPISREKFARVLYKYYMDEIDPFHNCWDQLTPPEQIFWMNISRRALDSLKSDHHVTIQHGIAT